MKENDNNDVARMLLQSLCGKGELQVISKTAIRKLINLESLETTNMRSSDCK